jgi:hypothetical protein
METQIYIENMTAREAYLEAWRWVRSLERAYRIGDDAYMENALDWNVLFASFKSVEWCSAFRSHTMRRGY